MSHFVKDFSKRTQQNMDSYKGEYEVTQVINSLLGMVIIPKEAFYDELTIRGVDDSNIIEQIRIIDSIVAQCDHDNKLYCSYKTKMDAKSFIRHIRNSVAHGGKEGLYFFPIEDEKEKQIKSIIFYDTEEDNHKNGSNNEGSREEFCVEMDYDQVRKLARAVAKLFSLIDSSKNNRRKEMLNRIEAKRKLFSDEKVEYNSFDDLNRKKRGKR